MDDLTAALLNALTDIAPKLKDPLELQRRLARRNTKYFLKPLRAFCIAVRANDYRINDVHAVIHPRHALSPDAHSHPGRRIDHRVELTKQLLQRICEPVTIGSPGEPAYRIADRLGCHPSDLRPLRRSGRLRTTPKPRLGGRPGPPVPVIYTPNRLDPQARNRAVPDDIFAGQWRNNTDHLPDNFHQWLTRTPRYRVTRGRDTFQGWYWICPRCRKTAEILYYPIDGLDFPTWLGFAPAKAAPIPKLMPRFACRKCHGVLAFSRGNLRIYWNHLILRLTGGLLYGHEVQKPDWLTPQRQHAYRPRKPAPAPRRDQIERLLVDTTLTYQQLATQLGISFSTVCNKAILIFKRHNVANRDELKSLLRPPKATPRAAG